MPGGNAYFFIGGGIGVAVAGALALACRKMRRQGAPPAAAARPRRPAAAAAAAAAKAARKLHARQEGAQALGKQLRQGGAQFSVANPLRASR
jgi:hypothetical protein